MRKLTPMPGMRRHLLLCTLLSALILCSAPVTGQVVDEYEVKAAFLFNFTKFVEWPATASPAMVIGILGEDPFGQVLDRLVQDKTANGRPIRVRRFKDAAEAPEHQIVFVSAIEKDRAAKLIEAVRGAPVLTVGETQEFLRAGGMISLVTGNNRVNIIANGPEADRAGLKISAKLMSVATPYKSSR